MRPSTGGPNWLKRVQSLIRSASGPRIHCHGPVSAVNTPFIVCCTLHYRARFLPARAAILRSTRLPLAHARNSAG